MNSSLGQKQHAIKAIATVMSERVELDVLPIFTAALAQACEALDAPMGCLHLIEGEDGQLSLVEGFNLDPVRQRAWSALSPGGRTAQALSFESGQSQDLAADGSLVGLEALSVAPVTGISASMGVLSFMWPKGQPQPEDPYRLEFIETVGHLLGLAIEHAGLVSELVDNLNEVMQLRTEAEEKNQQLRELNQQLSQANQLLAELSTIDGLTGIANHRHLHELLKLELARAKRQGFPLCLIMADLDHFKRVNDQLGHKIGDEALKLFANLIKSGVREVDSVGRYGGEEFLLILVDCDLEAGVAVAEKLRLGLMKQSQAPPLGVLGGITVSMGVALWQDGLSPDQFISKADQALYAAKTAGRNQVVAAKD